jgi:hypothetical protein
MRERLQAGLTPRLADSCSKANYPLGLLKRLDQAVKQGSGRNSITEADAVLVMLEKGVH